MMKLFIFYLSILIHSRIPTYIAITLSCLLLILTPPYTRNPHILSLTPTPAPLQLATASRATAVTTANPCAEVKVIATGQRVTATSTEVVENCARITAVPGSKVKTAPVEVNAWFLSLRFTWTTKYYYYITSN